MDMIVKADNPKGLAYDHMTDSVKVAKAIIGRIVRQGGTNITINGKPVPETLLATLNS
jgi:hypothetical protein